MKITNPFNNEIIGEVILSDLSQALKKVALANGIKPALQQLSSGDKSKILQQIVAGIKKRTDNFIKTIVLESGKPYRYAKEEVNRAIQTFTIASEECKRLPHQLFDLDSSEKGRNLKGEIIYFPKGVILGISPFNFPINLAAHKIAPAIAAACPIILKPSGKTPLTMELLSSVISETDLPKYGFQLLHCTRETGDELIQHSGINILSFTGSPNVGWKMKEKSEKKQVILELGGNAAAIIHKDANLDFAVKELLVGGFAYSGQVCVHTQRIYVYQNLFDSFIKSYVEGAKKLKIGDPIDPSTEFGVMINEDNAVRIEKWVNEAVQSGAKCLLGGKRDGNLYYPTILTNVHKGQLIREEEAFGPVVIIEPYKTINEAVQEVNNSRWGLQAAIFTDSISIRNAVFNQLEVGALIHNRASTFRVDDMIYGGIKDSGFGREGVRFSIQDYLEPKLLVRE